MRKLLLFPLLLGACIIDAPDYSADDVVDPDAQTEVTLTVTLGGNSVGTVTAPEGIDCGADCTLTVPGGTTITLTATPGAATDFTGWSGGGCAGTDPCAITLTADTTVAAAFDLARFTVTVTPGGNGTGAVTSSPTGIDCGSACTQDYDAGTSVTLTATPELGSTFVGWTGGGCTGTGPCTFDVDADVAVQASFALDNSIVVTLAGNGTGGVTSNPVGIDCGSDCDEAYGPSTSVTLTALATGDSVFTGWSGGGCGGTGTCMVVTDSAVLVTATFILNQHTLSVAVTGTGSGVVSSVPGGITCPGDCTELYDSGTSVVLSATPVTGKFAGWSGACTGLTCTAVLDADRSVTATFTLITVGDVTSSIANGMYTIGTTIPVQLTFSDPVTVTGTPTLALNTGGVASYVSGSGTSTLTFDYAVAAGHTAGDLDYSATTSLVLNGGTIKDGLGNVATLTLPAPGAAGSLGANKAIVIDTLAPVLSVITGAAAFESSTSATLLYSVTELHPGATDCMLTVGTGTITICGNTGAALSGLNQGAHTISVTHTDGAGNVSAARTFSWTVDTVAPVVSVISGPASPSTSTSATLSYTVTDTNLGSTGCTQSAGTGTQTGCTNSMATYTGLNTASHTVSVTHTDLAGNVSTAKTYTWSVCPVTTFTFTTVSTGTAFTVPTCGTSMEVYAWGAGGGGGGRGSTGSDGDPGGGGGFAGGTLTVTEGQMYQIAVGSGGGFGGNAAASGGGGTNGGGNGAGAGASGIAGGGGGGWSGVYAGATYYVIAAGGGGAGAAGTAGGAGGGAIGTGGFAPLWSNGGGGGTQGAGGVGGTGDPSGGSGTAGASRQGGAGGGAVEGGGGGGGAGFFGGGGGGGGGVGAGGGGGSSFTAASLAGGNTVAGTGASPGNTASPHYTATRGAGGGSLGTGSLPGNDGLVVIVVR